VRIFQYTISEIKNPILLEILEELKRISESEEDNSKRNEFALLEGN
jgi:hypothetical protein